MGKQTLYMKLSTHKQKAVTLLCLMLPTPSRLCFSSVAIILCASVVSYVAFVLTLFVPHCSFFCFKKAVLRECGIFWVQQFHLPPGMFVYSLLLCGFTRRFVVTV